MRDEGVVSDAFDAVGRANRSVWKNRKKLVHD
jgi:hypothetical protein